MLFLDKFSTAPAIMLVVMMEAIAASWVSKMSCEERMNRVFIGMKVYGIDNLVHDIRANLGFEPNRYFRLAWKFFCPGIVTTLMIFTLVSSDQLKYRNYTYPPWAMVIGWCLNIGFLLPIPLVMLYAFIRYSDSRNTFKERLYLLFVPDITKRKLKQQTENGTMTLMSSSTPMGYI